MSLTRKSISSTLLMLLLFSCATPYREGSPNFTLRGAEQIREIKRFELNETFEGQGLFFLMGPKKQSFTLSSINPLIKEVSPEAYEQTISAQKKYAVAMILGVAFGLGGIYLKTQHHPYWALASAGTGFAFASYGGINLHLANQEAARKFNKDIHKKFVPALGYSREF